MRLSAVILSSATAFACTNAEPPMRFEVGQEVSVIGFTDEASVMLNEVTVRHPSWSSLSAEERREIVEHYELDESYLSPSQVPQVTFSKGLPCILCTGGLSEEIVAGKEGKILILGILGTVDGDTLVEVRNSARDSWGLTGDAYERSQFFWWVTLDKRLCPTGARIMLPMERIREAAALYPALRQRAVRDLDARRTEDELRRNMLKPPRPVNGADGD